MRERTTIKKEGREREIELREKEYNDYFKKREKEKYDVTMIETENLTEGKDEVDEGKERIFVSGGLNSNQRNRRANLQWPPRRLDGVSNEMTAEDDEA